MAHYETFVKLAIVWETILVAVLLYRLVRLGLGDTYRFLFRFFFVQLLGSVFTLCLPLNENRYAYFYLFYVPLQLLLGILCVYELYANILKDYPGIITVGRWLIGLTSFIAIGIAFAFGSYDWKVDSHVSWQIFYVTYAGRAIKTIQVLFLLGMTIFLRWFPGKLNRNVHVHGIILFVYFLAQGVGLLLHNRFGSGYVEAVNIANSLTNSLCLLAWCLLLSPSSSPRLLTFRPVPAEEEVRILKGLRAINETLVGAGKENS